MLVNQVSATLGRPWEDDDEYMIGLQANHTTMVKLSKHDRSEYHKIYNVLEQFSKNSVKAIGLRSRMRGKRQLADIGDSLEIDEDEQRRKGTRIRGRLPLTTSCEETRSLHVAETLLESLPFDGMNARQLKIEQPLDRTCQWIYGHPKYS